MLIDRSTESMPLPSYEYLRNLMNRYQLKDLVNEPASEFRRKIDSFLSMRDYEGEGFKDPRKQRDISIRFHWGHNHDFGDFQLQGVMGNRHLYILAMFMDRFGHLGKDLRGKRVLDIGCWTGGTSLLLAAMGAEVVALDEVRKYVDALEYLKRAFGVVNIHPRHLSLYECTDDSLQDAFDIVLFAGVLYHVSDPVLALRLTFNCVRDGGTCLVESAGLDADEKLLAYQGPTVVGGGREEDLTRTGWNWFLPTPGTLKQMMCDVGYEDVTVSGVMTDDRLFAVGRRSRHVDMFRGGLSQRWIR